MKISVVTPSFNQAAYLEECIQSVLDQNYANLEYVIIDGGSTDGSLAIIKKYAKYLHYWISEKDQGHADALNKGFAHTSGEIMSWLNSDDKYLPWTFETVSEIYQSRPEIHWTVGFNSWWNDKGVMTHAARIPKNIYDYLLGNYRWVQQESVFWRRELWQSAGGYISRDYRYMVDGELWSRFFLRNKLYAVDCVWGGYRAHSKNRAKLHRDECISEMTDILGRMKRSCENKTLSNYKALRLVQILNRNLLLRYTPFENLMRRLIPDIYADAAYDILMYDEGRWVGSKQRFTAV